MRLIDADVLKEELTSHFDLELEPAIEKEVLRMIDEQETISVASPKWISVKDRLPDSDRGERWVFTWDGSGQYGIETWSETYRKWTDDEYRIKEKVSYWMPLPAPPEVEDVQG